MNQKPQQESDASIKLAAAKEAVIEAAKAWAAQSPNNDRKETGILTRKIENLLMLETPPDPLKATRELVVLVKQAFGLKGLLLLEQAEKELAQFDARKALEAKP